MECTAKVCETFIRNLRLCPLFVKLSLQNFVYKTPFCETFLWSCFYPPTHTDHGAWLYSPSSVLALNVLARPVGSSPFFVKLFLWTHFLSFLSPHPISNSLKLDRALNSKLHPVISHGCKCACKAFCKLILKNSVLQFCRCLQGILQAISDWKLYWFSSPNRWRSKQYANWIPALPQQKKIIYIWKRQDGPKWKLHLCRVLP